MSLNPFNPHNQYVPPPQIETQQPVIQEIQPMMQSMMQPMMQEMQPVQPTMQSVQPTMQSVQSVQPVQAAKSNVQPQQQTQQSTTQSTPMFVPTINPGQGLVCQFSPAKFDAFVKVLGVLDDRNIIVINGSSICQSINNGTAILMTDVSVLIDDNNNRINLHILNPKKYLKYFKNMKGSSNVFILDDPNNQRYIVTNGDVMVYLPKQIEEFEKDASPPDLSAINIIGKAIDIDKETRNIITTMGSGASHLDILIHQNQMKGVYIPDIAVKSFKEYISEQIDDTKSELRLRSYAFLSVPGEEYRINIGELNGNYWMTTLVNTGFITIYILESLQSVSDENLII